MKLIPPVVYRFNSAAEEKIFHALKNQSEDESIVLHSLNLPEHDYKQWAEADFVVISCSGIMVLEVKGGRVSCTDGVWSFTNRYGETTKKSEGPFEQAKGARISLEKLLRKKIKESLADKINFGAGVMFPDIEFDADAIEMPSEMVFDLRLWEKRDLSGWFRRLAAYWAKRTGRNAALSSDEIKLLVQAMRPSFDHVPPLMQRVGETMGQLVRLTEDQYRYLDILVLQKRVVIEGGAGTGKTLLAMATARILDGQGKKVAFLCRSPVLCWHIRSCLGDTAVTVFSLDTLREAGSSGELPFDVFIIDEGQDFLQIEVIAFLDSVINGGLEHGSWLFFMDSNNQGGIYEQLDQDSLAYLRSAGVPWPLKENCRNTVQIAMHTMLYTGGDIGQCHAMGEGLKVEEARGLTTQENELAAIEMKLESWIDNEHVSPSDITILSPCGFEESVASKLSKRWRRKIHVVDENFGGRWLPTSLTFCTIRDFKGLESRYIMMVDLDRLTDCPESISLMYVAMTRANAFLWLAVPGSLTPLFERLKARNVEKLARYLGMPEGKAHG